MSKKPDPSSGMEEVHPLPRRFAPIEKNKEARGVFYFHNSGDYLYGYLLCKEKVETPHYPFISYKMKAFEARQDGVDLLIEEDQIIEFPANIVLRRKIDDNELMGSLVKIVFTGNRGNRGQQKDYKVFKDTGTFRKNEIEKRLKAKKHRSKKKTEVKNEK